MKSSYTYNSLSHPRHIRVLKILPSFGKTAPICVLLQETPVDNPQSYEALSYTWAGQTNDLPIECNGAVMLITANAESAIRRLRRRFTARYLWIDAICINQSSLEEKNSQVAMMAEIYSKARQTLVWLGLGNENTDAAMSYIRSKQLRSLPSVATGLLGDSKIRHQEITTFKVLSVSESDRQNWLENQAIRYQKSRVARHGEGLKIRQGFQQLLDNPYWTRLWTVQEVALSRSHLVYYGDSRPVSGFQIRNIVTRTLNLFEEPWDPMTPFNLQSDNSLLESPLYIMAFKQATVPHDLVYGLRSLFPKSLGLITVDYSHDLLKLYTQATKVLIDTSRSFEVLDWACHRGKPSRWPSWVPDFSSHDYGRDMHCFGNPMYHSLEFPHTDLRYSDDLSAMFVPGFEICTITNTISGQFPLSRWSWLGAEGWKSGEFWRFEQDFSARCLLLQQFIASTSVNSVREPLLQFMLGVYLSNRYDTEVLRAWVSSLVTGEELPSTSADVSRDYMRQFGHLTSNKRFFLTSDGRIGLAGDVQVDDIIVSLSGCPYPFALRREHPGTHRLVSSAEIQSFQGERSHVRDAVSLKEFCLV